MSDQSVRRWLAARWWLEDFADENMTQGGEYGGPVPVVPLPDGMTGVGKGIVVEFWVTLADGTRLTATRPLAAKD